MPINGRLDALSISMTRDNQRAAQSTIKSRRSRLKAGRAALIDRLVARLKFSREAYGDEREEQGIKLGIVKVEAKGKAEGLAEASSDIAMRMLKKGNPDAEISDLTGLNCNCSSVA